MRLLKTLHKMLDLARYDLLGSPKFRIGSVDITRRCNLNCVHCYFRTEDYHDELSDEGWISLFERLRGTRFPFYQCSWIGGEPLLRAGLVGELRKLFQSNLVATNGTIALPDWPDVNFYVSVDGTEKTYERMRGRGDLYGKIKENATRPDLKVVIAAVITRLNADCIDEMVAEWKEVGAKGIYFQFYTPIRGMDEGKFWLDFGQRDRILDRLIGLRHEYGDFMFVPEAIMRMMKSDRAHEITGNCLYAKRAFALDPMGRRKRPCMLGRNADCSRCGCVLPFYLDAIADRSFILREASALLRKALARSGVCP